MKCVVQRVTSARVEVDSRQVAAIGRGLLLLVGVEKGDAPDDQAWLTTRLTRLRIFPDESGGMNRSIADVRGEILAVSQFTLLASLNKGARPSWSRAAPPEVARPLFDGLVRKLEEELGQRVSVGVFGAHMQLHLVNDGPLTLVLDSRNRHA